MRPIRDEAYEVIKKNILRGIYKPKQRLKETELAAMLGVSRTPVREAMRKLEIDGLIEYKPQRGTVVADFDINEIVEIYEVRSVIEVLIMKRAAKAISDELIKKLEKNIERFKKEEKDEAILDLADEFNELIYEASQCKKLVDLMRHTREYFKRVRISNHTDPERRESAISEHEKILMALKKRDILLAEKYALEHIKNSKDFIIKKLNKKGDMQLEKYQKSTRKTSSWAGADSC